MNKNNTQLNEQLLRSLSTHFDLSKIIETLESRYNEKIDPFELYVGLSRAKQSNMNTNDVLEAINKKIFQFKKPISSDLMYLGMLDLIFFKEWNRDENLFYDTNLKSSRSKNKLFSLNPDYEQIFLYWLNNKEELFKTLEFKYLRKYDFAPIVGDLNLQKETKNSNLRKIQNDLGIDFKNLINQRLVNNSSIELKNNLIMTKNNKHYIVVHGDKQQVGLDPSGVVNYAYSFKLISAYLTSVFVDTPIHGYVLVNNDANRDLSMTYFDFNEIIKPKFSLKNPTLQTNITLSDNKLNTNEKVDIFTNPKLKDELRNVYSEFEQYLSQKYNQSITLSEFYTSNFETIENELSKDFEVEEVDTVFTKNTDVKYYDKFNSPLLSENQQQIKFLSHLTPTPSQLNAIVYLSKDKSGNSILNHDLKHKSPDIYWSLIFRGVVNKYGYELNDEQLNTLINVFVLEQEPSTKEEEMLSSPLNEIIRGEDFKTLVSLGHYNEPMILSHFASLNKDLLVKSDKRTLYSKQFNTPFDIDGYIGNSLDDIDQVIEIKNTLTSKDKIVNSYWVQMTYYNEILKPKNGVKMVASIKSGSNVELYTEDFVPSKVQKKLFYDLYNDFVIVNEKLHEYDFFNIKKLTNEKLNQYLKHLKKDELSKDLIKKQKTLLSR